MKITKIACLMKRPYLKNNRDLQVSIMICTQKKLIRFALSSNDNKRVQTFDRVTTFPHRTSDFKVCEDEMLNVRKAKETLKILSKECKNELYVIFNIFLNYMKTKCAREMKKYVTRKKCKV